MKCNSELINKSTYYPLDDAPPIPCLDIVLHNPPSKISVKDTAEIDTGFDYSILLTSELVELLKISFDDSENVITPDRNIISCGVADISIKIGEKWLETQAHYSKDILAINPILGRGILNNLNLCFRGKEKELYIASIK